MSYHGNRQKHLNRNPIQRYFLRQFHLKILKRVKQTRASRLLDAGCGEGFVIKYLRQRNLALQAIGGDFSSEALLWGRANVRHNAPLVQFDIHRLPFPDNSFPLVISLEVLEHLPDSRVGLQELARVSAEYVLVSVPHEPLFRGANFLRGKHFGALGNDPEHLQNYSGRAFKAIIGSVLDIVWHGYTFPWQIALGRKRKAGD